MLRCHVCNACDLVFCLSNLTFDILFCRSVDTTCGRQPSWLPWIWSFGLVSLPTDIPTNSTTVTLKDNRITNMTAGVFAHLYQCSALGLSKNQISVIESGTFIGLTILESLDLSYNYITQIDSAMLIGLKYLNLSI